MYSDCRCMQKYKSVDSFHYVFFNAVHGIDSLIYITYGIHQQYMTKVDNCARLPINSSEAFHK